MNESWLMLDLAIAFGAALVWISAKEGVPEAIRPEIEAAIEITRHILCQLKVPVATIEDVLSSQRKICPMWAAIWGLVEGIIELRGDLELD